MRFVIVLATLSIVLLRAHPGHSQLSSIAASSPQLPATRTLYFDAKGRLLPSADSADHREQVVYRDSIGGTVRVYYPSGKLRRVVPYLHFARGIKYGAECGFYETGELKSRYEYGPNGPVGPVVQYYRSGQVRLRTSPADEAHPQGLSEAFSPEGQPLVLTLDQQQMPTLNGGGPAAIVEAIQRRVRYPVEALRAHAMGKVFVTFLVDDAGFIRNVRIVKTASPLFNMTVLQAVASLGRLTPGAMAGEPIDVAFTMPVTFAMQ
ncbi:MAG: TonB family protein [Janthinobacterium lividum]